MRKEKRLKAKIISALLVLTVAFTMAGCKNSSNNKKSEETKPKTKSTQLKATIAKVKFKPSASVALLPKTIYENKKMLVGYTQHGIFFYDKKAKKIKRGIKVKTQKKIKLNAKGLGTYIAFTNKAKTKIFIVNKEAGKSTNKEYYVYDVKSKKLKTINKAYPKAKMKKFAKMLKKQKKGWKKIKNSKKLKDVVYVSAVDGKTYKPFIKQTKKIKKAKKIKKTKKDI